MASPKRSSALRLGVSAVVLLVVFVLVLPQVIDYGTVVDSIRALSTAELAVLMGVTILKWAAEGMIYAAVLPTLGPVRGSIAYLSSTAAVNTVPGPVDLAVRYGMYRAWKYPLEQATAAVVAGGIFSTMAKLVLPGVAVVVATIFAYKQDGLGMYALIGTLVAVAAVAFVVSLFRSETQARALGDWAGRFVSKLKARFGGEPVEGVGERFAGIVHQSSSVVRDRWPYAVAATLAATLANFAVLLLALRFSGVPDDVLSWVAVFTAFATVQFLTVVPITSGNVGISELVYIGTMGAVAGPEYRDQVAAGVFVYRLFTWLLVIPVGWCTMFVWQAVHRRKGEEVSLLRDEPPELVTRDLPPDPVPEAL